MGDPRWGMRHAPELAEPAERGDVWVLTHDGKDVPDCALYGHGFTQSVVDSLNADESTGSVTAAGPDDPRLRHPSAGGSSVWAGRDDRTGTPPLARRPDGTGIPPH